MDLWLKFSLILCIFGFAKELRPSEPFITEFLSGDWRNITTDEVIYILKFFYIFYFEQQNQIVVWLISIDQ